jgi:pyruvate/oxaloacetate carboxyltransferase
MTKPIKFVDLTLRDGQQSVAATRMTTEQAMRILPILNGAGYAALELWGGATLDSCVRFLGEDPWERLEAFREALDPGEYIRILLRGQNLFAYQPYPDDLVIAFVKQAIRSGANVIRIFDALNDWRNLQMALIATKAYGGKVEASISYTVSPVHTIDYFVDYALKLEQEGADQIAVKDMAGLLYPTEAVKVFQKLKAKLTVPLTCHSHTTTGVGTLNAVIAMQTGVDYIDTAITPFAGGTSHPPIEVLIVFAEEMGLDHGMDKAALLKAQTELFRIFAELEDHIPAKVSYRPVRYEAINRESVREIIALVRQGSDENADRASLLERALALMRGLLRDLGYPPHEKGIFKSQIPGGMLSNLQSQLKHMGQLDRIDQIMEEIPQVRRDVGYVPLVTPTSQIIGSQATFNVMLGQRYQMVSNEFKMLLRGEFGQTPAPINPEVIQKVLDPSEELLKYRPASYLHPVLEDEYNLPFIKSHKDLLLHLMLKQPADEFLKQRET